MRSDYTDISIVLDRSGSMVSVWDDTIGGFNAFIQRQQELPGKCNVSLCQFDNEYECLYTACPIHDAPLLTRRTYEPRGSTALLQAMCLTIHAAGARLAAMPEAERPARVLFVTITDGQENASPREYTYARLCDLVTHQRKEYNWDFVYLGANQDAFKTASRMGFLTRSSMTYTANDIGTASAFDSVGKYAANVRGGVHNVAFDDEDKKWQADAAAVGKGAAP